MQSRDQENRWAQRNLDSLRWQQAERGPASDIISLPPRYECFARDVPLALRGYILRFKVDRLADAIENRHPIEYSPKVHTYSEAIVCMTKWRASELDAVISGGGRSGGGPKRR